MDSQGARTILIAGAGIAGLTAALALAERGFLVRIFERTSQLEEVGAGLQISPNATRILGRLGVLEALRSDAVRPDAVVLRNAADLGELARVPLGEAGERRWGAPYLVAHRADLQRALLAQVAQRPEIELVTGAEILDAAPSSGGVAVSIKAGSAVIEMDGLLLVGADGVWSRCRALAGGSAKSRFTGELAWRTTISRQSPAAEAFAGIDTATSVTAFLHPGAHLIAYPVRGGSLINLVAFTPGTRIAEGWSGEADIMNLRNAFRESAPALSQLAEAAPWTVWPLHTVDPGGPWTSGGIALIGDAAHAMTPFAAQGAAMAIEDAATLADAVAASADDLAGALAAWEAKRRPRIIFVARRGAVNRFAWHASGPVALVRNLFLKNRPPEKLAADLDWLYGWDARK